MPALTVIVGMLATSGAGSQEPVEVRIPAHSLSCLVENQEKYLGLPRNVIIFFADYCPAVSREEVTQLVQNSAEQGQASTRLIMLKSDFECLVQKISEHLAGGPDDSETGEALVAFSLNCQ